VRPSYHICKPAHMPLAVMFALPPGGLLSTSTKYDIGQ
jgi:hypothetical protein